MVCNCIGGNPCPCRGGRVRVKDLLAPFEADLKEMADRINRQLREVVNEKETPAAKGQGAEVGEEASEEVHEAGTGQADQKDGRETGL